MVVFVSLYSFHNIQAVFSVNLKRKNALYKLILLRFLRATFLIREADFGPRFCASLSGFEGCVQFYLSWI